MADNQYYQKQRVHRSPSSQDYLPIAPPEPPKVVLSESTPILQSGDLLFAHPLTKAKVVQQNNNSKPVVSRVRTVKYETTVDRDKAAEGIFVPQRVTITQTEEVTKG